MLRFLTHFLGALFALLVNGLIVAVLVINATLALYTDGLPSTRELAAYTPKTISQVYSSQGRLIDEFAEEKRLFTPIGEIPALVKRAFISAEDKNFYQHTGFDARGIVAAIVEAIRSRGRDVRGASTITQQVVKNFLLSGDRRIERKIRELILATRIEAALPKERILELYLNEIFLGRNSYGVTAAARTYFNKPLSDLASAEAAYLAALPKAPSNYHPVRDREAAVARRNFVLREMHQNGYLDDAAYAAARAAPLKSVQAGDYPPFDASLPPRDYFTDEIRRQLSRDFGESEFFGGGLTIRATIDPELQRTAEAALRDGLETYDRARGVWRGTGKSLPEDALDGEAAWRAALAEVDIARDIPGWHPAVVREVGEQALILGVEDGPAGARVPRADIAWMKGDFFDNFSVGDVLHAMEVPAEGEAPAHWSVRQIPGLQGAFVAMDVQTGRVLAMQGGFSYQNSSFNRATQATRQPGSNFKPFVYAAALDSGFTPATIVLDAPISVETDDGLWQPRNASQRFYGPTPMRTGIVRSRNVMTVRIAREVGMQTVAAYAERFGLYDDMQPFLSGALGAQETTLYQIASAYAMFANGGERIRPTLVDRVQDRFGRTILRHDRRICLDCDDPTLPPGQAPRIISDREQVIDPVTAYQVTSMMQDVVRRGTAAGRVTLPVPVAGKTGTTNEARDVWFTGFTSNIVAGCYMGFDTPRPLGAGAFGGSLCAPVFDAFMDEAVKKYGGGPFRVPEGGHFIRIDRRTGARLSPDATGENVVAEYFRDGTEPVFGVDGMVDGGFAMGENLPILEPGEEGGAGAQAGGDPAATPPEEDGNADFGTLSSGGLY